MERTSRNERGRKRTMSRRAIPKDHRGLYFSLPFSHGEQRLISEVEEKDYTTDNVSCKALFTGGNKITWDEKESTQRVRKGVVHGE